jgi:hypothetical protein
VTEQLSDRGDVWYEAPPYPIGENALYALTWSVADAPIPAVGRRRWLVSDYDSLTVAINLEDRVKKEGLPADAPESVRGELNGYLDAWYMALPFSEAERGVVLDAYRLEEALIHRDSLASDIRKTKVEVVAAGVRSVVKGRDLMRRWWSWRRELDEFAGQGSLTQARVALTGLVERLIPPEELPIIAEEVRCFDPENVGR